MGRAFRLCSEIGTFSRYYGKPLNILKECTMVAFPSVCDMKNNVEGKGPEAGKPGTSLLS